MEKMRKHKKQIVKKSLVKYQIISSVFRSCKISQTNEIVSSEDNLISKSIGIPVKEYRKFLVENFNAQLATLDEVNEQGNFIKVPVAYFKEHDDAKEAVKWIDSTVTLINKLSYCS